MRVGAHAITAKPAVDLSAALDGMFLFLKHDDTGALPQNEPVAVLIPGSAGGGRIVIAGA